MSMHLIIGSTSANWRLPAETNPHQLRDDIAACMESGNVLRVTVEMGDNPLERAELLLNGKGLPAVAVVELAEPDSG
jgi:hypothetical protein